MSDDALVQALAAMVAEMRAEARMQLETFMLSGAHEYGGTLKIFAPCSANRRLRYEVGFRSERFEDSDLGE